MTVSPALALSLSSFLWSGNFIVGRALRDAVDPLTLNYWRWVIALLILLPFSLSVLKQQYPVIRQYWKFITMLAITGIAGFHFCVYRALQTTYAINAILFLSISPLMIILGSRLAYKDRINVWQLIGILLSLAGVVGLLTHGELQRLRILQFNTGDLWMLLAVVLWSVYSVILKRKPQELSQTVLLNSTVIFGVIMMTPFYLLFMVESAQFELTLLNISGLLYISIFAAIVAYFCWNYGVSRIGPNSAGSFLHLMPLFGAVLSVILLGEGIKGYHLAGAAFIATGITISSRFKERGA